MAKQIKIKVLLNKGRTGVPLAKLPKMLGEFNQFLDLLSKDLGIDDKDGWQGVEFKNSSLAFSAVKNSPVEEVQVRQFATSLRRITRNEPDERVSSRTRSQFAKIAGPIDPDEAVLLSLEIDDPALKLGPETEPDGWYALTKQSASEIQRAVQAKVKAVASVQGTIHSVFIEADDPHFRLKELSSKNLINCYYGDSDWNQIADALRMRRAVIHVFGVSTIDTLSRKLEEIRVDKIEVAEVLDRGFLSRFIGSSGDSLESDKIQDYIDDVRRRGEKTKGIH